MKSVAVFGGIAVIGAVMAFSGGMDLGKLSSPPFNYEAATKQERAAFLHGQAEPIGKALKIGLVNPSGVGTTMKLAETKVHTGRREITYIIKVRGRMETGDKFSRARDQFLKKFCPKYLPSPLGNAKVRMVQKFVDKKNQTLRTITISVPKCKQYV